MGAKEDEFRLRLAAAFRAEAAEHVAAISSGLSSLDNSPLPENLQEIIETTYREMHTLKGAARSVNETEIESLCQSAESALSALRHSRISFSRPLADLIFLTLGRVNAIIEGKRGSTVQAAVTVTTHDLITALERVANGEQAPLPPANQMPSAPAVSLILSEQMTEPIPTGPRSPVASVSQPSNPSISGKPVSAAPAAETRKVPELSGTIRVPASKMDAILRRAEELITQKESLAQNVRELQGIAALVGAANKEWIQFSTDSENLYSVADAPARSFAAAYGKTTNLSAGRKRAEFAEQNIRILKELDARVAAGLAAGRRELHTFNRQVNALLSEVREVMLVPASSVLMFLPLTVQEMAASRGKEAGLVIEGGDKLVDRRILEGMKDPLIHLARNAVDHGIEQPEERIRTGKPAKGKISVSLAEKGENRIEIAISDDGRGIDFDQVRAAAKKIGIADPGVLEQMDESGLIRLLFRSGLSTSPIITELSGRGLGLSIVEERVELFDGEIAVQTRPGKGTRVQITLPVRLATLRGVIVRAQDQLFIIPRVYVGQVLRVDEGKVQLVENCRTIRYREEIIPLVSLAAHLSLPRSPAQQPVERAKYASIITSGSTRIALEVDEIIQEQELSQKSLGPQLARVRNIAGAAIGRGGNLIPVLNIADIVKAASHGGPARMDNEPVPVVIPKIRKLLVVEDSITARTLLKNILEAAGYMVKTAVDGLDAWTILKTDPIDLVVSDVEMPRMNGFDLTTAIRHDRNLAELPVVLVTALASRGDRERGIDAGANAYIVKSSFDQSNLLDVLGRLVG
jgi:two-component system, chemotaxis family, sensor kinase CheA